MSVLSATGTRTYTNRFGATFSTPLTLSALTSSSLASPVPSLLLYLNSAFPVDANGLTFVLSSTVQQPGAGPLNPVSTLKLANVSGQVVEVGSTSIDGLGSAFLSSIAGFTNVTIGASNLNTLAVDYGSCQAPITSSNGLRQPTQPTVSNGAAHFMYSYLISDGATYSVAVNLSVTASSGFAIGQDQLGNPSQTLTSVTGTRLYTYLPTGAQLLSAVAGLTTTAPVSGSQLFYPYTLISASPGVYTEDVAPFIDGDGLQFDVTPAVPVNGLAPGAGTLASSVRLQLLSQVGGKTVLAESAYVSPPLWSLQQQLYTLQ